MICSVDKEKQVDFWVSLFNVGGEKCTVEETEKVLKEISGISFDDCIEEYCRRQGAMYNPDDKEYDELTACFQRIRNSKQYRWIYFYYGIISEYYSEMVDIFEGGRNLIADRETFMTIMTCHIIDMLNEVAYRSLIVEVNYMKSSGKLLGDTPEKRAEYYSDTILRDKKYVASVMSEYPEMVRLFHIKIKNSLNYFRKIITDTYANLRSIENELNCGEKLGRLQGIVTGSGDTHNGGQSVARLIFENGKIIIYKPHSLAIDLAYNSVMEKISDFAESLGYGRFYLTKCFTVGDSGWTEFICSNSEPRSVEEIQNYHKKLGILSCVLYLLSAGDMHSENIIALKESPVIIDLETVIQPRIVTGGNEVEQNVRDKIINSVKGTLVFPVYIFNNHNGKSVELGGVGNVEEQDSAFDSNFIASIETDNVKLEKRTGKVGLNPNVLTKDNKRINAADYYLELCVGFSQMYHYIMENRSSFCKLLCESFQDCLVRVLYRSTWVYGQLLDISYHPDLLGNPVDRLICLHRLGIGAGDRLMVAKEIEAMRNGDIPFFQISSGNNGTELTEEGLYSLSPVDNIREKLQSMDETDLRRQLMVIKSCFAIISDNRTDFRYVPEASMKLGKDNDREIISLLCQKLFANAIEGKRAGEDCFTWLGCIENDFGIIECQDIGDSLYYGRSGIAFALYCAYIYIGDEEYLRKADIVMELVYAGVEAENLSCALSGAYDGIAGILFVMVFCREKFGRRERDECIKSLLEYILDNCENTEKKDIIGGSAGILKVLTYICNNVSDEKIRNKTKDILRKIAFGLFESTSSAGSEQKHFVGYAHGDAGIISALVCSREYAGLPELERTVETSLEFQNGAYSEKANNWSRTIEEPEHFNYGWCHGAPGVLLSRTELFHSGIRSKTVINDMEKSIKAVKEQCFGKNYCLCHGDAGNLLILRTAAQVTGNTELARETEANLNILMKEKIIPACNEGGLLNGYDDNGLFCGIAGLIYTICKFRCYDQIPDILELRGE